MNFTEKGTFLQEAQRRVPEKIIINDTEGERFMESNKKDRSFLLSLGRELNPNFQLEVDEVKPILIYGTVDPVGNASELLTMMNMAIKLNAPMALTLDDVCHDLADCGVRVMTPSWNMAGLVGGDLPTGTRFTEVMAEKVLPVEIMNMLEEFGLNREVNLAEAYEAGLYLLAQVFFGERATENIVIMRSSVIFDSESMLGQIPLSLLRKKVEDVAVLSGKESLVFAHLEGEKIRSDNKTLEDLPLCDLYKMKGNLGGTAWVSLTTMLLDKNIFGDETHPLVLAEKDTTLGSNFASVYEKLLVEDVEANKIAISGIRRIKAIKKQGGGDGIDPLVLLYLLQDKNNGAVYKSIIEKQIGDGFPLVDGALREKELVLGDEVVINTHKVAMLKETFGVGGNELLAMGVDRKLISKTLLFLAERMIGGEIITKEDIKKFI